MNINTHEFIKLCLLYDKYLSENRLLEFFKLEKENAEIYKQYISLLCDQIHWEKANEYLKLVGSFVNNNIKADEFQDQFYELRRSAEDYYDQLLTQLKQEVQSGELIITEIAINPKSKGFASVIVNYIFDLVELYDPDITFTENLQYPDSIYIAMSGPVLRALIDEIVRPKLENYCTGGINK